MYQFPVTTGQNLCTSLHETALKVAEEFSFHLNWALHKGLMYVFERVSVSELNHLEGHLSSYSDLHIPQILFDLLNSYIMPWPCVQGRISPGVSGSRETCVIL